MCIDHINYEGIVYPTIDIHVNGYGIRTISTETLEDKVLAAGTDFDRGNFEARYVDSMIFFYVPDSLFKGEHVHENIRAYVHNNLVGGVAA